MKLLGRLDVLQQVATWRALVAVSAFLLGAAVSGLIGQSGPSGPSGLLAGYLTADILLTVALLPIIARIGPRAVPLHLALAASWIAGAFFLAQLL